MTAINPSSNLGGVLAERLGLNILRHEGHDLVAPCLACQSSDAFRLHREIGVAQCYSCGSKWSPFQVAEAVLGDRAQARDLMVELGVMEPSSPFNRHIPSAADPIQMIAAQKGIKPESLVAYGASMVNLAAIRLPAYGADGATCTTFTMTISGGKGLFEKGKPAGLFLPLMDGVVRLPKAGETWHLVEGPKDAAALHGIGLLACGLNTCRLAAKFGRLFAGVDIVLIPDRDRAGEDGAQHSGRVLRGIAKSIRIAVLPAEFRESSGDDVRDVLRRPDGQQQLEQAIADAQPLEPIPDQHSGKESTPTLAMTQIELPEGDPLTLTVHPPDGRPQRLVVVERGEFEHRDRIDTNSSVSRDRLTKKLAAKLNMDRDQLAALVEPQIVKLADQSDHLVATGAGGNDDDQSQATMAAIMAAEWEQWHTPGKDAFVTIPVGEHFENWSVKSQTFKRYVAKQFFDQEGKAMNSDALSAAVNLIEAKALFEGEEHPVHVRVAEHHGNIYLDLCNDVWQVVEITANGWQVIDESPVKFRRSKGMLPLPIPVANGVIDELRNYLNVDDATWPLIVAWLVANLRPIGPYPLLALFAEQGSGKSTTGRLLRSLIDPNSAPLRAEPKDGRDLMIAANNSWCLAYDNLSHVPSWLSDAMCRLSTGGGFATRELFTDQDEIIFDSQRPVMLTSIEEVATRSDLLDRCLIVWLPSIPEERRRPEAQMMAAFEAARPRIMGALLDAVSVAIRDLPTVQLPCLPRMADFALWVTAAETALGWERGTFLPAYQGNRASANDLALESSPVARPVLDILEESAGWSGTASELLQLLEAKVADQVKRQNGWPKNARSLSGQIKRLSPNLRAAGWDTEFVRQSNRRVWMFQRMTQMENPETPFASLNPREEEPPEALSPMQFDADSDDWPYGDAYDADDANPRSVGNAPHDLKADREEIPF